MLHPLLSPVSRLVLGTVQVYCALFYLCVVYLSSLYEGKRSEVSVGWCLHVHYGVQNGGDIIFSDS